MTVYTDPPGVGLAETFIDAQRRRSWLEVRDTDGGPTDWSREHILRRIAEDHNIPALQSAPGIYASIVDAAGRMSDLTVNATDGQIPDWVINRWAQRLGAIIAPYIAQLNLLDPTPNIVALTGSTYALTGKSLHVRGKELLPILANKSTISAFGASNIRHWYQQLAALGTHYGVSTFQGGCDGDTPEWMGSRMGVPSYQIPIAVQGGIIAAGVGGDTIFTAPPHYGLSLIFQTYPGISPRRYTGWLSGAEGYVYGYIWQDNSTSPNLFKFRRLAASGSSLPVVADGTALTIAAGTPFLCEDGPKHRADISILGIGNNGIQFGYGASNTITVLDDCFNWLAPLDRRVLVHNHYIWPGMAHASDIAPVNAHIASRYGSLMIDVNGLILSSAIWSNPRITAAGISPTAADTANQANGVCPASLLVDGIHFNDATNNALLDLTIAKIDSLGWYS